MKEEKKSPMNTNKTVEEIKYKLLGNYYVRVEFKEKGFTDICTIFGVIKYLYKYKDKAKIIIQ